MRSTKHDRRKFLSALSASTAGGLLMNTLSPSSAPLAISGLVFAGGLDGQVRAYDAVTGKILWSFDTVREFKPINGIKGTGGAMDGSSPIASDGMLYVNAGYGMFGEIPGNVLLAFDVQKK